MEHLTLPALDTDETHVIGHETLEVERLGEQRFRLLHSPAFVWGVAAGDVIELDGGVIAGFQIRSRAGNVAAVVALNDAAEKTGPLVQKLIQDVALLHGRCEGGPTSMLVFTIPVDVGLRRITTLFDGFRASVGGSSWWYGNVLDRHDRLLAWCQEHT